MVEARLTGDFGIVQEIGVEFDARAARRAAEKIDHTAFAQHFDCHCCQVCGKTNGFNDDVGAASAGQFAHCSDGIRGVVGGDDAVGA